MNKGNDMNAETSSDAATVDDMLVRKAVFEFLSAAYLNEMSLDFLERLKRDPVEFEGELGEFVASLAEADLEAVRTDLTAEYARVFLGMSPSPVAPYESVYASDLHILMQEPRDQVLKEYRAEGLAVAKELRLPEDHIAFEFAFMAHMCQKAADALDSGDEFEAQRCLAKQRAFLDDHLLSWVPDLCADVAKRAHTSFYRGVAQLTEACLAADRAYLAECAA